MSNADIFEETPIIETSRLQMRGLQPKDAIAFFNIQADPQVMQYFAQKPLTRIEQAQAYVQHAQQEQKLRERITWTVVLKGPQAVVGRINLHSWNRQHQYVEVGYMLSRRCWGQGYGTEMLRAVVAYVFRNTMLNRIEAHCFNENHASYRVMEKAGMSFEGIARQRYFAKGTYRDIRMYAILREDFLSTESTYLTNS